MNQRSPHGHFCAIGCTGGRVIAKFQGKNHRVHGKLFVVFPTELTRVRR